jgi:YHS domain-containing protein
MKYSIIIALFALFSVSQVQAQRSEIYVSAGKSIKGYDPVAFFKVSKPVRGTDSLAYQWKGATWLFSSRENLAAFNTDPDKYAPQYGGYCAYGASQGHKAPTQADTWTVLNDKLYFNYSKDVQVTWNKDRSNLINVADQKWTDLKDKN